MFNVSIFCFSVLFCLFNICLNKPFSSFFIILSKDLFVFYFYHLPQRLVVGDASETALLKFTELTIGNIVDYRNRFKKVVELPFNSTNKFQVKTGSFVASRLFSALNQVLL